MTLNEADVDSLVDIITDYNCDSPCKSPKESDGCRCEKLINKLLDMKTILLDARKPGI